jgi:predicted NAD/FAD-dependent oxidoreductase
LQNKNTPAGRMTPQPRVLVVGGGLTAAALAHQLRGAGAAVSAWDKAGRSGGRFTSHRRPDGGAGQVDLGGQFLTVTEGWRASHRAHYARLVSKGLLRPLQVWTMRLLSVLTLRQAARECEEEREEIGARRVGDQGWNGSASL